jgi:hypothetical protein
MNFRPTITVDPDDLSSAVDAGAAIMMAAVKAFCRDGVHLYYLSSHETESSFHLYGVPGIVPSTRILDEASVISELIRGADWMKRSRRAGKTTRIYSPPKKISAAVYKNVMERAEEKPREDRSLVARRFLIQG